MPSPNAEFEAIVAIMIEWPDDTDEYDLSVLVKGAKELVKNDVLMKAAHFMLVEHSLALALRPLVSMVVNTVDERLKSNRTS